MTEPEPASAATDVVPPPPGDRILTVPNLVTLVRLACLPLFLYLLIGRDDRVVCVLTGHVLKDPDATVAYHSSDPKTFDEKLGKRGVKRASFANRAVQVPNDLNEIIKAIELYA